MKQYSKYKTQKKTQSRKNSKRIKNKHKYNHKHKNRSVIKGGALTEEQKDLYKQYENFANNDMNHENFANKVKLINKFKNPVTLIFGAYNDEPHVTEFMNSVQSQTTVICIRKKDEDDVTEIPNIIISNNGPLIYFNLNFNLNFAVFRKILHVNTIIVDWSTAKFFKAPYKIISENICQLLTPGGRFYSQLGYSGTANDFNIKKTIPDFIYLDYINIPKEWLSDDTLLPSLDQYRDEPENTKESLFIPVMIKYKEYLIENKPENCNIKIVKSENEATDTYPLKNPKRKNIPGKPNEYPYEYFYLEKKGDDKLGKSICDALQST